MKCEIDLLKWAVKEVEGEKKITGTFVVRAGAVQVAQQDFNGGGYMEPKVPLPPELMVEANALTAKIAAAITKNFIGGQNSGSEKTA